MRNALKAALLAERHRREIINPNLFSSFTEDFRSTVEAGVTTPWTHSAAATTADNATVLAPDGTATADLITASTTSGFVYRTDTVSPLTDYMFSFFIRGGSAGAPRMAVYDAIAGAFILQTLPMQAYGSGGGFVRPTVQFTTPAGCTSVRCYPVRGLGTIGTFLLWGAKLETGWTATPYVANSGKIIY